MCLCLDGEARQACPGKDIDFRAQRSPILLGCVPVSAELDREGGNFKVSEQ